MASGRDRVQFTNELGTIYWVHHRKYHDSIKKSYISHGAHGIALSLYDDRLETSEKQNKSGYNVVIKRDICFFLLTQQPLSKCYRAITVLAIAQTLKAFRAPRRLSMRGPYRHGAAERPGCGWATQALAGDPGAGAGAGGRG